jgi:hypothetical protein
MESRMIDTVQHHIHSSTANIDSMNMTLQQLMSIVNKLATQKGKKEVTTSMADNVASLSSNSNSSSSRSSMSTESLGQIQSPEHKRQRSAKKPPTTPFAVILIWSYKPSVPPQP